MEFHFSCQRESSWDFQCPRWPPPFPNPENSIFESASIPDACQNEITGPANSVGTSQFHKYMVAKTNAKTTMNPIAIIPKILTPFIPCFITQFFCVQLYILFFNKVIVKTLQAFS